MSAVAQEVKQKVGGSIPAPPAELPLGKMMKS